MRLNDKEVSVLLNILDDEILAKNVYGYFYELYPDIYYFNKIRNSEIVHETSVKNVLKYYNISNIPNSYNNIEYEEKEKKFKKLGKKSLKNALLVSIDIEIEDIKDIENTLKKFFNDKLDIKNMLEFLLQGSYNHYNMFRKLLNDLYNIDICKIDKTKCIKKPFKKEVWMDYKEWYWFNKNINF